MCAGGRGEEGGEGVSAHVFTASATACMTLPKDACVLVCKEEWALNIVYLASRIARHLLVELGPYRCSCSLCCCAPLFTVSKLHQSVTRHSSATRSNAALALACVCSAWISAAAASSRVFACFAADSASCLPRAACCTAAAAAAADRCMSCSAAFFCTRSSKTCAHQHSHARMRNSGCSQAIAFALQCRTSSCVSWGSWSPTPSCSSSTWGLSQRLSAASSVTHVTRLFCCFQLRF